MKKLLVLATIFIGLNSYAVSNSLSIKRLVEIQQLNNAVNNANDNDVIITKMWNALNEIKKNKDLECQFAFGHQKFCACLSNNLPLDIYLEQYTKILTSNKEKLLRTLSTQDREIVNLVYKARDKCVTELG